MAGIGAGVGAGQSSFSRVGAASPLGLRGSPREAMARQLMRSNRVKASSRRVTVSNLDTTVLQAEVDQLRAPGPTGAESVSPALRMPTANHKTRSQAVKGLRAPPSYVRRAGIKKTPVKQTYMAKPNRRLSIVSAEQLKKERIFEGALTLTSNLRAYYLANTTAAEQASVTDHDLLAREALRFEPRVLFCLEKLWFVTDMDGSGDVDFNEYHEMYCRLYKVLVGDDSAFEVRKLAWKEYQEDCCGKPTLYKRFFQQAWFQMADTWGNDTCVDEYCAFLDRVTGQMIEKNDLGQDVWKDKIKIKAAQRPKGVSRKKSARKSTLKLKTTPTSPGMRRITAIAGKGRGPRSHNVLHIPPTLTTPKVRKAAAAAKAAAGFGVASSSKRLGRRAGTRGAAGSSGLQAIADEEEDEGAEGAGGRRSQEGFSVVLNPKSKDKPAAAAATTSKAALLDRLHASVADSGGEASPWRTHSDGDGEEEDEALAMTSKKPREREVVRAAEPEPSRAVVKSSARIEEEEDLDYVRTRKVPPPMLQQFHIVHAVSSRKKGGWPGEPMPKRKSQV